MSRPGFLNTSVGEYRLVDFLGAGGMGEVYRAVHAKLGRVVAVKVLTHTDPGSGFVERFLNEARIQATLQHPNIAALYDFLELDGRPCIIMEYVDGQTLAERIAAAGPLPLSEAVFIFQAIAEGIDYIHRHGVVHRDIKANNIKVSSAGQVKLLDFGIAKTASTPRLTRTGDVVGTLEYLSPELLRGQSADARSDIWALGVLFYEMVTGRVPFEATTIGQLCERITKAHYPPASALNPSVPGEIEAVISRCLKKRPADRYPSTQELLQDALACAKVVSTPRLSTVNHEPRLVDHQASLSLFKAHWPAFTILAALLLLIAISFFIWMDGSTPVPISPGPGPHQDELAAPMKTVRIDVFEGRAEVFRDGRQVGTTPFELRDQVGRQIKLVLRREGFVDRQVEFTLTGNKKVYTFLMEKKPGP